MFRNIFAEAAALSLLIACAPLRLQVPAASPKHDDELVIRPSTRALHVGENLPLLGTLRHPDSASMNGFMYETRVQVEWTSSDTKVLVVDWYGLAVAKAPGQAKICGKVYYTYLPITGNALAVDYSSKYAKLWVRPGSTRLTCSGELTVTP